MPHYWTATRRTFQPPFPGEDASEGDWMRGVHPNDLPGLISAIEESARAGSDFNREFRFVSPEGKVCWVHSRTAPLRSETGEITGRVGTIEEVTERKVAETQLERVNQELIKASREAGSAEFANGVLHNVNNVINSINISAEVIAKQLHESKASNLPKVTALLREHTGRLGAFLTEHPRGKLLPGYLEQLAEKLVAEQTAILGELKALESNVQHIKAIVTTQQNYGKRGGTSEKVKPIDLMEDSLRINAASLARHNIQVVREHDANLPEIVVEKHHVLQILVNFIRNAKDACLASDRPDKKLVLRVANDGEFVQFSVKDNGIGIPPENLDRLFKQGFTTKKDGHGFGLHSATLAVRQLGGDLQALSDGVGKGATFSLKLPLCTPAGNPPATDKARGKAKA